MAASSSRRVAVVAVHGVADQQPGDTSTAIANLLLNLNDQGAPVYPSFTSEEIRIPVRPLHFEEREAYRAQDLRTWAASQRSGRSADTGGAREPGNGGPPDAGLEFMKSLVSNYEPAGGEAMYETVVRRGTRQSADGPARVVDIYEMYWADLSRLSQSWVRIFAETYQLMFHLGSLGVHAILAAEGSDAGSSPESHWKLWGTSQRLAANILAQPILVLNLCLAALIVVLPANIVTPAVAEVIVWCALGGLTVIAIGVVTYRAYARAVSVKGLTAVLLASAAIVATLLIFAGWPGALAPHVLGTMLAAVAALAVWTIVKSYDRYRPGTWALMKWPCALVLVWYLVELWVLRRTESDPVLHSALHTAELVFIVLRILWVGFIAVALVTFGIGDWVVWRSKAQAAARDRLRRVKWTARLTLMLPAVLFLLVTTILWGALWPAVVRVTPFGEIKHERLDLTAWVVDGLDEELAELAAKPGEADRKGSVDHLVQALIVRASGAGFLVLMVSLAVSVGFGLYGFGPAVLTEIRPPPVPRDGTSGGRWLDGGFRLLRWGGRLMVLSVLVVPVAALAAPHSLDAWNEQVLMWAAAAVGAAGGGLMVFRSRLKSLTLGFRGVVDVALDVDNYLREHPRGSNPRGRIAARMASLLRHVYEGHYDAVVIIAHSQGTVITADLLRLIESSGLDKAGGDLAARGKTPVYFFTMGSPLRQLYGLRFPHLYHWARHQITDHWRNENEPIDPRTGPNPAELGVQLWVNAYRSGDYVGRYLWRPEKCDFAFKTLPITTGLPWPAGALKIPASTTKATATTTANRREFCIGSGGHQHYWDHTAPHIAMELDNLITR